MTSKARLAERERLHQEGREAFLAGARATQNPYKPTDPDSGHWQEGWEAAHDEAEAEAAARKRREREQDGYMLRLTLANAIHEHASSNNSAFTLQRLMTALEEWEQHIISVAKEQV